MAARCVPSNPQCHCCFEHLTELTAYVVYMHHITSVSEP